MEITAPRRADLFASLPCSAAVNIRLLKYLLPAMLVLQLYLPGEALEPCTLQLLENGSLRLTGPQKMPPLAPLSRLCSFLRQLGAWSHPMLAVRVPNGHSIHYAGTLPMGAGKSPYRCSEHGKLRGTGAVYIADSSTFPVLPAKNMSFTMMANAMRVARHVAQEMKQR